MGWVLRLDGGWLGVVCWVGWVVGSGACWVVCWLGVWSGGEYRGVRSFSIMYKLQFSVFLELFFVFGFNRLVLTLLHLFVFSCTQNQKPMK